MEVARERPVFILSAGWRAGSTLLQRLLCSHPRIMIWGENHALVEELRAAHRKMAKLQALSRKQKEGSSQGVHQAWIPMVNPEVDHFERGLRALLESTFAEPAHRAGKERWGFKEVRHDMATAEFLSRLFPESRFLLLVRHPQDCLASARATTREGRGLLVEAGGSRAFVEHWRRLTESFLSEGDRAPSLLVRYESMVEAPHAWIERIAKFLDEDPSEFDVSVFDKKLRGWRRSPFLTEEDLDSLETAGLWNTASRLLYDPAHQYVTPKRDPAAAIRPRNAPEPPGPTAAWRRPVRAAYDRITRALRRTARS